MPFPTTLVVCAENIETTEVNCSKQRSGWRSRGSYSLKVPPGRYYVYGVPLKQAKGKRVYYTDFIQCGMDVKCKSHQRIMPKVKAGENVTGHQGRGLVGKLEGLASLPIAIGACRLAHRNRI